MRWKTIHHFLDCMICVFLIWLFLCLNRVLHADANGQGGDESARNSNKKAPPAAAATKPEVPDTGGNAGEPEGSESDDSDDSM
ncbi:hypothetical protein V6N12_018131 [Hibiscus sabdariffa]|uniref:Uncharacterized protein n=1 Tax=Hibiscus sabdariffa TaxID=183260 RepID=A0ABR2ALT3_9ROSI